MKAGIATALENAEQLHAVLEEEFQALTIDDIDGFEKLQPAKNELLAQLTGYVQTAVSYTHLTLPTIYSV